MGFKLRLYAIVKNCSSVLNLVIKLILFVVSNGLRFVPTNRRTLDTLRVLERRELSESVLLKGANNGMTKIREEVEIQIRTFAICTLHSADVFTTVEGVWEAQNT
jgi:hypothetical protein